MSAEYHKDTGLPPAILARGGKSIGERQSQPQGMDRIRQMNEAAGALTEALGLPPEQKYHTLELLFKEERPRTGDQKPKEGK